ncbi:hypothetical protein GCM10011571_18560 [Marinithermofilum abyssi]|uniref:Uncharacterized protein n=1 Tax=Marinithermofilum abyssi TaxID=1571185 RepID=A0A8J2VBZ2_9BACL|nr:hypothetical protein [Marinithermofilum abyssi]GGE17152.1 hypothetical protein GCM10011571_18560 [Marinithermofilum abyssi]
MLLQLRLIGVDDVKQYKPSPTAYTYALDRLNCKREETKMQNRPLAYQHKEESGFCLYASANDLTESISVKLKLLFHSEQ